MITIQLYDKRNPATPTIQGGLIGDYTRRFADTWKSTQRGIGGYWQASCEMVGEPYELEEFFVDGLLREVVAYYNGIQFWRGFVSAMRLTKPGGEIFEREWARVYNRVKAIFSHIGENQFTNGSAESAAWDAIGTPTTNAQSTTWVTDQDYSNHIITDAANEGAIIQDDITIIANKAYQSRVSVNIVSGAWSFQIYRIDTNEVLGESKENGTGEYVMSAYVADSNTYEGDVGVKLICTDASGEIYGDAAVFQDAPYRAETHWYEGARSMEEFGKKELAILLGGMSSAGANSTALTRLRRSAWARSLPPADYSSEFADGKTRLEIVFSGYVFTLSNQYIIDTSSDAMSDIVTRALEQSQFISAGIIDSNDTIYQPDDFAPITLWDVIEEITSAGDDSGARWACAVYDGLKLDYVALPEQHDYIWQNGQIKNTDGTSIEPWLVKPGYIKLIDMPLGPEQISGYETDDPRVVYIEEIEFDAGKYARGENSLRWVRGNYDE